MYFPYLFGKQAELLAVRKLAGSLGNPQKIVPIIEPVNDGPGLRLLHAALAKSKDYSYVVRNPNQLDLAGTAGANWQVSSLGLFATDNVFHPTLKLLDGMTATDVADFVKAWPNRHIGVIIDSRSVRATALSAELATADFLAFATSAADRPALATALGAANLVHVDDRFVSQSTNAGYSGEEFFTNEHRTFAGASRPGFSDYTVLRTAPSERGGPAGAVVIHLGFKKASDDLWVQHFLSDDQDQTTAAGAKLLEAIRHIETEVRLHPTKFERSPALAEYLALLATGSHSNLTKNKELQIAHHLFSVGKRLGI